MPAIFPRSPETFTRVTSGRILAPTQHSDRQLQGQNSWGLCFYERCFPDPLASSYHDLQVPPPLLPDHSVAYAQGAGDTQTQVLVSLGAVFLNILSISSARQE